LCTFVQNDQPLRGYDWYLWLKRCMKFTAVRKMFIPIVNKLFIACRHKAEQYFISLRENGNLLYSSQIYIMHMPVWDVFLYLTQTELNPVILQHQMKNVFWTELLVELIQLSLDMTCCTFRRLLWKVKYTINDDHELQTILTGPDVAFSIAVSLSKALESTYYCKRFCFLNSLLSVNCKKGPTVTNNPLCVMLDEQVNFFSVGSLEFYRRFLVQNMRDKLSVNLNTENLLRTKNVSSVVVPDRDKIFEFSSSLTSICENIVENATVMSADYNVYKAYRTEKDWEKFLEVRGFRRNSKSPLSSKMYSDWISPLFRVWIAFFGLSETKKEAEEEISNMKMTGNPSRRGTKITLWQLVRNSMNDGELLHVAVDLGSLKGVEQTAWPGFLKWNNEDGKTALEYAKEVRGEDDGITKYLSQLDRRTRYYASVGN